MQVTALLQTLAARPVIAGWDQGVLRCGGCLRRPGLARRIQLRPDPRRAAVGHQPPRRHADRGRDRDNLIRSSGADAMARAHQRAIISGTELRLVVTAQIVCRVFGMTGIDRLVPLYPCLAAAMAAGAPKMVLPLPAGPAETEPGGHTPRQGAGRAMHRPQGAGSPDRHRTAITPAVMWKLIDGLQDGVVLADGAARAGQPAEGGNVRLPAGRTGRSSSRVADPGRPAGGPPQAPGLLRPGTRGRANGLRCTARRAAQRRNHLPGRDQPQPPTTTTGQLTLAVTRDLTQTRRREDLLDMARAAVATVRFTAAANCSTGSPPACTTSGSACKPPPACPPTRPDRPSQAPSTTWTTRSAISATSHSPTEPPTGKRRSWRPACDAASEIQQTHRQGGRHDDS